jgi:hypothetical protein
MASASAWCVHGFFGLNAFLLGFPFSQRATCCIAQLVTCVNEPLNFRLSRAHSLFKALQVLAPGFSIAVLLRDTCAAREATRSRPFLVVRSGTSFTAWRICSR